MEAIYFIAPANRIRVKAGRVRPEKRDKPYKKIKCSGLETDKDNFKVAKMHLQKMIIKKEKSYFEEELVKNRSKPKELGKALKSLGISSNKAKKIKYLS